jgi:hypothetical protein
MLKYFWPNFELPICAEFRNQTVFVGCVNVPLVYFMWVREYYRGKYHCTVDLLFDWFGISCMSTDNFCFYLQNKLIPTGQTRGQRYSDTSPFCIPCMGTLQRDENLKKESACINRLFLFMK